MESLTVTLSTEEEEISKASSLLRTPISFFLETPNSWHGNGTLTRVMFCKKVSRSCSER
jgi:hypothetical protein